MFEERFMPMFEADGAGGAEVPPTDEEEKKEEKPKTFDEMLSENKEYQSEFDRRIAKGIKTAIENEKKRVDEIVDERLSEAERLAKMTEMERRKYEQDKRDEDIKRREAEITRRELQAQAMATLAEKNLPANLVNILDFTDAESCKNSIATVETVFNDALKDGIEDRLKGGKPPKAPKNDGGNSDEELTKKVREAMARPNRLL